MKKADSIAARLIELAATLKEDADKPKPSGDELLTLAQVLARYGMGRTSLDTRGIPKARYGRAYRWRESDIEKSIEYGPTTAPTLLTQA